MPDRTDQSRADAGATGADAAIIDALPDLVARWDRAGRLERLNPAGRRLLGYVGNVDITSLDLATLLSRDTMGVYASEIVPTIERNGSWTGEAVVKSRDGRPIDVSAVVVGHKDAAGSFASFSAAMRDITGRKQAEALLRRVGERDPLTGLLNRAVLDSHLEKAVASAARGRPAALLVLDLDHFANVNDALGHAAGDRFLVSLAQRLDAGTRDEDVLARIGGDKFALLARGVTVQQAQRIGDGLHALVSGFRFEDGEQWFGVGVSLGVAMVDGSVPATDVLARADAACFQAKADGRNRIEVWTAEGTDASMASSQALWESVVEEAIETDKLRLVYLPVVRPPALDDVSHHEVLVRMVGEDGQLIPPSAFLEAAERFGLAKAIDKWVIEQVLSALTAAAQAGSDLCLAVNLSSPMLSDPDTVDLIIDGMIARDLPGTSLILEVAEPVAVTHVSELLYLADCLRPRGVRLAIDDVGVGVSPFAYLRLLPADILNLDASFTRDVLDGRDNGVLASLVSLAHQTGALAAAKSLEDPAGLTQLAGLGVDLVQGWAVGSPGDLPL